MAMGDNFKHKEGSWDAAASMIANEAIAPIIAWDFLILPFGIARSLVRGLRASISLSINLLSVIAAARAPAKASVV